MQVLAFSVPTRSGWSWRIVNYAGEMVEESFELFPTIETAVEQGRHRLRQIDEVDRSDRPSAFTWRRRGRA